MYTGAPGVTVGQEIEARPYSSCKYHQCLAINRNHGTSDGSSYLKLGIKVTHAFPLTRIPAMCAFIFEQFGDGGVGTSQILKHKLPKGQSQLNSILCAFGIIQTFNLEAIHAV